jgi:uncharacterized protein (TIGR02466 family)
VENNLQEFTKLLSSGAAVTGIFPNPVYKKNIGRPLTELELKASLPESYNLRPGSDNLRADSTKILTNPAFFGIKNFIDSCLKDFLKEIVSPSTDFNLYVTQSWINFNREGDKHHQHFHANSIVSGVFYLNTSENDMISFYIPQRSQIHIMNTPNWWNMRKIGVPVRPGDCVLFMSDLEHGVERQGIPDHTRVSLAFNTWFKGEIGSEEGLTHLKQ